MKKLEKPVLADGEMTGHVHELQDKVDVYERDDKVREFSIEKETSLTHQEHKTIAIPAGDWCSDIVVETDPFEGERRVID